MKGLVVWAQSACRSQMALYRALGRVLDVPLIVPVWFYRKTADYIDNRTAIGFSNDEFSDMAIIPVGEDYDKGVSVLDQHPGWTHLFCNYQGSKVFRALQMEANRRKEHTAVGSESPCNMFGGVKYLVKEVYLNAFLRQKVKGVVDISEFFVNYSGNDNYYAKKIGWPEEKIIPFGYFPPPLPGTMLCQRKVPHVFEILATGVMLKHRGIDVLMEALVILKKEKIPFHATVTQTGPLMAKVQKMARAYELPVNFTGFLPMEDLHKAYENCSVYVGAGRHEPWGMRLNDALNCGAPLLVSRGMGGVKMVDDYGCGLAFENESPRDLARQIKRLIVDADLYTQCATNAVDAARCCMPENKAVELLSVIKERFPQWLA